MMKKQMLASVLTLSVLAGTSMMLPSAEAQSNRYDYGRYHNYYNRDRGFLANNPYLKKAVLVGGGGAVVGGLLAGDGGRAEGAVKGALLGAGLGMGYEYLKRQGTFSNNRW